MTRLLLAAAAGLALTGSLALAAPEGVGPTDAGVLADADGMTLYTFDNDSEGTSVCYDDCAVNWPPFLAAEGAEEGDGYTLVTRDDGSLQWALDGMPLYYWIGDTAPGDTNGDGVGGVWHVIQ
ncbi:hypothetical protein [Pseudoroseicyclus sp. CXY001]|uniref:COG4315 family predicted lipoprotein n=1 Tax=Pseudoroseicyclus sp. CXY001 TaxID=3242492 RepID=UPI003570B851